MRRSPLLTQLLKTMSMMRYGPPKGTAGLARSRVSGYSRSPCPPPKTTARVCRIRFGVVEGLIRLIRSKVLFERPYPFSLRFSST